MPIKFSVHIAQGAQDDLEDIWNYLAAQQSVAMAAQFVEDLIGRVSTLEQFPERCSQVPENELLRTAYRHLILRPYRVLFRIEKKRVIVLRIIHGGRLLDSALFD